MNNRNQNQARLPVEPAASPAVAWWFYRPTPTTVATPNRPWH
jgi:hypothetical protein